MKKESYIEKKCCEIAKQNGYVTRKLQYIANNGAPDRIFFKKGHLFFVEFKKEDGTLSKLQEVECEMLRLAGQEVYEIRDIEQFKGKLK